jgi:hypothetical protein
MLSSNLLKKIEGKIEGKLQCEGVSASNILLIEFPKGEGIKGIG